MHFEHFIYNLHLLILPLQLRTRPKYIVKHILHRIVLKVCHMCQYLPVVVVTIVCPFAALAFAATIAAHDPVAGTFLGSKKGREGEELNFGRSRKGGHFAA